MGAAAHRRDIHDEELSIAVEPAFDLCGAEYGRLFAASDATAFQHPLWLQALYRDLAPRRNAERLTIVGRAGRDRRAVFLLPLIRRSMRGVVLIEATDLGVSDYAAPVVDRTWREAGAFDPHALAVSVAAALPSSDFIRIRPVREEHAALWRMFLDVEPARLDFSAHALEIPPSGVCWRDAALTPGFRKTLERKRRGFARLEGTAVRRLAQDEAAVGIDRLARLRKGRFEGDLIAQDFVEAFYAGVATAGAAEGISTTYVVEIAGEPVGHAFGLTYAGRFNYLLIGCDYERHGRHSPGLMLFDRIIDDWAGSGGRVFDFTIGDEPFKKDFGAKPTPMFELRSVPTVRGRIFLALKEARDWLRVRRARGGVAASS